MKRLLLLLAFIPRAWAQYPNKPIRMIVPFAPGGASDFVGRILQPRMSELLGQQLVVENRAGASGNIGMDAAAKSTPDGYTIYLGNIGTVALNPAVFPKLQVKPTRDFIAITQVVDVPGVLVVHPDLQAKTVKDIVAIAKAYPGKLNYASPAPAARTGSRPRCSARSRGSTWCTCPTKAAPARRSPDLSAARRT